MQGNVSHKISLFPKNSAIRMVVLVPLTTCRVQHPNILVNLSLCYSEKHESKCPQDWTEGVQGVQSYFFHSVKLRQIGYVHRFRGFMCKESCVNKVLQTDLTENTRYSEKFNWMLLYFYCSHLWTFDAPCTTPTCSMWTKWTVTVNRLG